MPLNKKKNQIKPNSNNLYKVIQFGSARGVMVIVVGNWHDDTSSNLDKTDCISHSTNINGKGMNPIILPPAMGK